MKRRRSGKRKKRDDDRLKSLTDLYRPHATGKRKREADAEVTEQARGVELEGSGIDNEEKGKEKKKKKISAAEWKKMSRDQRKNYLKHRNR